MRGNLDNPIFQDADKAREWLEAKLWVNGVPCPHCGVVDGSTVLKGTATRPGLRKCNACIKQFTVTVGTIYERSHIPLNKWLLATYLMAGSKKGMSAHQIHRMLGITYKSAWFMCHRIREAMRPLHPEPLGGENKVVEVDETYVGGKAKNRKGKVPPKEAVVSLVERDGFVRSNHVPNVTAKTLGPILAGQMAGATYVMTDESPIYPAALGNTHMSGHGTVNHSIEEYVRGHFWHTNTIEGYFSILKRGIVGTYHHISQQHLKRYLAEFDFRYNTRVSLKINDGERADMAVSGIVGKRLTYRRIGGNEVETETPIPF